MSINLFMGCMFSGKTRALINAAKVGKILGKNVLMINYIGDNRYTECNQVTSHCGTSIDAVAWSSDIMSIMDTDGYKMCDIICVNEGQFFTGLVNFCVSACESSKTVYVCGLDGDYLKRPFGEILNLIPHCEKVEKLHALCLNCRDGSNANFTKRITNSSELIVIGSSETYQPVCRKCYSV